MPYNFIQDFIEYGSGSECPRIFIQWAALNPLAVAAGRQYHTWQGRILRRTELCLAFVGPSGGKKSYAKDLAKDIVIDGLPEMPIAADITSRDDLIRLLASKETERFYIDHQGAEGPWHPMALYVDEIRHFMSYSPSQMIAFLVAIYGQKYFKGSTIKRGVEEIVEPCVNILGCTTEDWIIENLKNKILAGGFSRRFIIVYEPQLSGASISWPTAPSNEKLLLTRMKQHLVRIQSTAKEFKWTEDAKQYFDTWYNKNHNFHYDDPHIRAYFLTKDMQLCKVCMLIDLASENPTYLFTPELIATGLAFFEPIETHLPRLYLSGGRNELAPEHQKVLDLLEANGGGLDKKEVLRRTAKDLDPMEQLSTLRFLQESGQLSSLTNVEKDGKISEMFLLPRKYNEVKKNNGKWK